MLLLLHRYCDCVFYLFGQLKINNNICMSLVCTGMSFIRHLYDDDDELFCGVVNRRKTFSLISSREPCQRSSPSRISDTPQAGFEPAQNLSSGFVEWSCAVVITTTPRHHCAMSPCYIVLHHYATALLYFSYYLYLLSICTRIPFVCHSYVLVCHLYVTRM